MAKMFYTLDEAKAALGKNEEEIKQLTREGRLREFRDGPRLMFKADQVEAVRAEGGGGGGGSRDAVDLGISDTGAPIGLVDSRGSSGSGISLADSDAGSRGPGASGSGISLSSSGSGMPMKEDTALAADLGLSGSMGGVPSPGRPGGGSGMSLSGSQAGHRSGISVFSPEEVDNYDPSAQTNISAGVGDQMNLDAVGSGSGLLDLTRESDDTSLGAELLDEIAPGGSGTGSGTRAGTRGPGGTRAGTDIGPAITPGRPPGARVAGQPVYLEANDPMAPAFAGAALGAAIFVLLAGVALVSGVMGAKPGALLSWTVDGTGKPMSMLVLLAIGAGASLVLFVIGMLMGKR